jgi:hypothetical protein
MTFQPGEIVLKRWTKARNLKRKVYRILNRVPGGYEQWRVVDPFGNQKTFSTYRLMSFSDAKTSRDHLLERARIEVTKAQNAVYALDSDEKMAKTYFPEV